MSEGACNLARRGGAVSPCGRHHGLARRGGLTVLMFCCAVSVPAGHHIAEGLQESKPLCNDVLGQ